MKKILMLLSLFCLCALNIDAQRYYGHVYHPHASVQLVKVGRVYYHRYQGYSDVVCRGIHCPEHRHVFTSSSNGNINVSNNSGTVNIASNGGTVVNNYYGCKESHQCHEVHNTQPIEQVQPVLDHQCEQTEWYIRFTKGFSRINKTNDAEIAHIVHFAEKHPNSEFIVEGYADRETGFVETNETLSQARAENVAKLLRHELGRDRIKAVYFGSKVQPYDDNNMNRCVIVKAILR